MSWDLSVRGAECPGAECPKAECPGAECLWVFCIHWVGTGSRVKIVKICLTISAGGGGSKLDCDVSLMRKLD